MKITIDLEFYTLKQAKNAYRVHFNMKDAEKVTKSDLAIFFGNMIQGDLDSIHGDESELVND